MSKRNLFLLFVVAVLFVVATVIPTKSSPGEVGLVAGRNVNMVSGMDFPGGDPWLQRQNEPSIAVSTRNHLHLLAGSNDYRSIDVQFEDELPGFEKEISAARDAWLGYYTSYDGGESWTSTLLPGYYHADTTPPGASLSPLLGYEAAADPVVRAGTNGLFYYSGITFNRGQRGLGQVFVARFIDNNNKETGAIEYIDTKIIDVGNAGHFIDKPWIAVDIPREDSPEIRLPNGQQVPCGNVYIVYTSFMGDLAEDAHSKIMFSMSTDCGETWSNPTQITDAGQPYQAAILAINPIDGRPYVAYRRFAKDHTDAIMMCWAERKEKETDEGYWHGKIKFSKPILLAEIDPFDQPTSEWTFRTNDYPTMTIDKDGVIYVAWSQRGLGSQGEGKILMMTSADGGETWVGPALVDDPSFSGYEFMPSLTSGAGKVMMLWYDQQYDVCGHFDDEYIQEFYQIRHTIDVRAAEIYYTPTPYFSLETIQVSRYPWIFTFDDPENPIAMQLQHNMPNLRIFGGGTVPFIGDYIDITPSPMFIFDGGKWEYNTYSNSVYHAVWTDNRDVRPPGPGGEWWNYVAPGEGCDAPGQTGIRNQNIYTSRITEGITAGSPQNTKSLNIDRAFVVFVKNTTVDTHVAPAPPKDLILEIVETSGATAYFMKAGENVGILLPVTVPPHSSVSATVMVESVESSSNEYATVRIDVLDEYEELLTYILLNPDSTNPGIEPHEGYDPESPHVGSEGETHTPHVGSEDVVNWDYGVDSPHVGSEGATSPHVGSNDDFVTPHVGSDDQIISGSTIHVGSNNHIIMSNIVNPHVGSNDFPSSIPENSSMTDIIWTVENRGNTTSTFSLSTFPIYDYDPEQIAVQLIVYKVYTTPTALGCELKEQEHHELIVSQTSPHVGSDEFPSQSVPYSFSDVTFSIPPKGTGEGEVEYKVILRYMDKNTEDDIELDPGDQGIIVESEAPDIIGGVVVLPAPALMIKTRNIDLDNGIVNSEYNETLEVVGGYGNYTWSLEGTAMDWLDSVSPSGGFCDISGTAPAEAEPYTLTVTVEDTDYKIEGGYGRPTLTRSKTLSITVYDPLNITTTSLPDGIVGSSYDQTLTATGGNGDYTWSLESGSLPDGLSLNSGGVINGGEPTNSDTFSFTVEVTDTSNPTQTDTKELNLTINAAPAVGAISGEVWFNGENITNYTSKDVELWARDEDTGQGVYPLTYTYDSIYGTYTISDLPPGNYGVRVYIDEDTDPPDVGNFPGDFRGWNSTIQVTAGQTTQYNLTCSRIMHLTSPNDNDPPGIQRPIGPPYPSHSSPVIFQWDAVPEATTYTVRVDKYNDPPDYGIVENVFNQTGITDTSITIALSDSAPDQHYELNLYGYNGGILVGQLMIVYTNGFGWDYRFTVSTSTIVPEIWRSPSSMTFEAAEGGANPSSQTLEVKNSGGNTLSYTITDDAEWLSVSPESGTSTGDPANTHTVSVDISGLSAASSPYAATITITAPGASNTPQTVSVTLKINYIMLDEHNASKWFGGDDRDLFKPRNIGVGQSIILQSDFYINSVGFKFRGRFDYRVEPEGGHDVTLVLNVRSGDGTIIKTVQKFVPATFDGGWITFDIEENLLAGEYIFTCYLKDGEILEYSTGVWGHTDNTKLPNSVGYSGGVNVIGGDMEDWSIWYYHPWDFNFKMAGSGNSPVPDIEADSSGSPNDNSK